MAAIGSLSPGGSSAPTLQVDLPSLTKLIVSAGTYGLKQLASAGISVHTIGCVLMIGEYTPASKDFRRTVNRARDQQRSQRLWMYKVIEIGTATNFLADQLLKTRAGENVLALLAATTSFTDEDSCVSTLAALFEGAKVSSDNIPGTGELRSLRNALAPLGRLTGFGDKLLRYHQFLKNISANPSADPYKAIPASTDIANLIRILHKICTTEERYILKYDGLTGAAWLVTYACEVLGLSACALNARSESHDPIPVTGSYEDANVIIDLAARETKFTLYLAKDIHEIITATERSEKVRRGWTIDCSQSNFLFHRHPRIGESPSYDALSVFTAIATLNRTSQIATTLGLLDSNINQKDISSSRGLNLYLTHSLPLIHQRCLRILKILGFRPGDLSRYVKQSDEDVQGHGYIVGHQSVTNGHGERVSAKLELLDRGFDSTIDIFNCLKVFVWTVDGNAEGHQKHENSQEFRNCRCHEARNHGGLSTSADSAFLDWALGLRNEIGQTVADVVEFASTMAFTDWASSLRLMSVQFFEVGDVFITQSGTSIKEFVLRAITLCTDNMHSKELLQRDWQDDWLAIDIDGVVVIRKPCFIGSLQQIGGQLLTFSTGRMMYEGTSCFRLRADRADSNYKDIYCEQTTPSILSSSLQPGNAVPSISVRHLFSNHRSDIFVRSEVYAGSQLCAVPDATFMDTALFNTFVTEPCEHGYFGTAMYETGMILPSQISSVIEGLVFGRPASWIESVQTAESGFASVLYQQTHDNDVAQWLACHWNPQDQCKASLRVLQENCCTSCVLDRANAFVKRKPQITQISIIAAGRGTEWQNQASHPENTRQRLWDAVRAGVFKPKAKAVDQDQKGKASRRSHIKGLLRRNRMAGDATTILLDLQTVHLSSRDDTQMPMQAMCCAVVTSKDSITTGCFPEVVIQTYPKSPTLRAKKLDVQASDVIVIFAALNESFCWGRNERNKEEGIVPLETLSILGDGVGFEQVIADKDYEDVNRLSRSLHGHFSSLPGLPFKKGDIIWIYEHLDSYLCWGRNIRTGNEGIFHPTYTYSQASSVKKPFVAVPEQNRLSGRARQAHDESNLVFSFGKERLLRRGPRREYFSVEGNSRYAMIN